MPMHFARLDQLIDGCCWQPHTGTPMTELGRQADE